MTSKVVKFGIDTINKGNLPIDDLRISLEKLQMAIDKYVNIEYPPMDREIHSRHKRATNSSDMCQFWLVEKAVLTPMQSASQMEVDTLNTVATAIASAILAVGVLAFFGTIPGWAATILQTVLPIAATAIGFRLIPSKAINAFISTALTDAISNINSNSC